MKRSVAALVTAGLIVGGAAIGVSHASAAPPTDPWSASATANTAGVSVTAAAVTVGAQIAQSTSTASSTAIPRTSATTQNVAAVIGGLGIGVQSAIAAAGPTPGTQTTPVGIGASVASLVSVGAISGSTTATWNGDAACVVPPQGLSSTTTTTAATSLAPGLVLGGSLATIGASTTTTATALQGLTGSLFGIVSEAVAQPVTTSLLNGQVQVQVTGSTSLQTVSSGTGAATVSYVPGTVRVTGPLGFDQTLTTGSPTATVGVTGVGAVTVTLNTVANTSSGTAGAASVSLATIAVSATGIASADIALLPLSVAAAAPAGGIDCAPPAPVILVPASGATTGTTPTISGTALPNTPVTVSVDGTALTPVTSDSSGAFSIVVSPALAAGSHTASATQAAAGFTSPASNIVTFLVDATPPAAPVIQTPASGTVTNDPTPAVTGTMEAGTASITLTATPTTGAPIVTGPIAVTGTTWGFDSATLPDGTYTLTAVGTDAVGNASSPSNAVTITVDTTAPAAPVITSPAPGTTTNDTTPPVSGTMPAGTASITLTATPASGTPIVTGPVVVSGTTWGFDSATLPDGAYVLTAVGTDAAGNPSAPSNAVPITVDTVAPAAPVITSPLSGSATNDTTPPVSGTMPAGTASITLTATPASGTPIVTGPVAVTGTTWGFDSATLPDGTYTLTAVGTDAAGNASPQSNAVTLTVDTVAPAAPVITTPATDRSTNDNTPTLGGTADAGTTVTLATGIGAGRVARGTITATAGGTWSIDSTALTDGVYTFYATSTDAAGNVSVDSNARTLTIDTIAPVAPVITVPAADGSTNDATPTLSGTGPASTTINLYTDPGTGRVLVGSTTSSVAGAWSITTGTLADGTYPFVAVAIDAAGNISVDSNTRTLTIDTVAPSAPVILTPASGTSTNDSTPAVSGTMPAGTTSITLTATPTTGAPIVTGPVAVTGTTWSLDSATLPDGTYVLTATGADAAGNPSGPSNAVTITVDTVAPAAPVISSPATGTTTDDTTPTVTGTGTTGTTVTVTATPTGGGTPIVSPGVPVTAGAWTVDLPALADGGYTLTATATDPAGNTSGPSNAVTITIDTVAPAAPVITAPLTGTTTTDATPVITGTTDVGSVTVDVLVDGVSIGTAPVTAGTWTLTPTSDLAEGVRTITAVATDAAGNPSAPSAPVVVTVDAVPPGQPVITSPANGSATNDPTPSAVVQTEPNATVDFELNGTSVGTSVADGTGRATLPLGPLADGSYTLIATATDGAGSSVPSAPVTFAVDTVVPAAPVITSPAPGSTVGTQPTVTGTAPAGSTVVIRSDGTPVGTGTATASGTFSIVTSPLAPGDRVLTAVATDAAGNASATSTAVAITVRGLALTGADLGVGAAGTGLGLLAAGLVLLMLRRRRSAATAGE